MGKWPNICLGDPGPPLPPPPGLPSVSFKNLNLNSRFKKHFLTTRWLRLVRLWSLEHLLAHLRNRCSVKVCMKITRARKWRKFNGVFALLQVQDYSESRRRQWKEVWAKNIRGGTSLKFSSSSLSRADSDFPENFWRSLFFWIFISFLIKRNKKKLVDGQIKYAWKITISPDFSFLFFWKFAKILSFLLKSSLDVELRAFRAWHPWARSWDRAEHRLVPPLKNIQMRFHASFNPFAFFNRWKSILLRRISYVSLKIRNCFLIRCLGARQESRTCNTVSCISLTTTRSTTTTRRPTTTPTRRPQPRQEY